MPTNLDVTQVPIDTIDTTDETQSRASMNSELISQYTEAMLAGAEFPPVDLFRDWMVDEKHFIADGHHRVHAARAAGLETINAIVHAGGLDEAIEFSCGANKTHGLYRSNADKRRAVSLMLERHANWSNRKIAAHVGVSDPFVGKTRDQLLTVSSCETADPQRVGTDGKARNAPTRAIGNSKAVGTKRQPSGGVTFDPTEWEGDDTRASSKPDNGLGDGGNEVAGQLRDAINHLNRAARVARRASENRPHGNHVAVSIQGILRSIQGAKSMMRMLMPAAPCECASGCDRCRQSGHLTDQQVRTLAQARR